MMTPVGWTDSDTAGISPDAFLFMSMQDVPDPNRPDSWRFFIMVSWPGEWDGSLDNAGRLQLLKNKASKLAEVRFFFWVCLRYSQLTRMRSPSIPRFFRCRTKYKFPTQN